MENGLRTHLVWFRNNLRLADNLPLATACRSGVQVIGLYHFEPHFFQVGLSGFQNLGPWRAKLLVDSLAELREKLSRHGIPLYIAIGDLVAKVSQLQEQYAITDVYAEAEWTDVEQNSQAMVRHHFPQFSWHTEEDRFLFHPTDIPFTAGTIPAVFSDFRRAVEKSATPREPVQPDFTNIVPIPHAGDAVPNLADLGFSTLAIDRRTVFPFAGGEDAAMDRLNSYFFQNRHLSVYKSTRDGLMGTGYSSKFSPWLAVGCISPRTIYQQVKIYESRFGANESTYWLVFELLWRDYFAWISRKWGNRIFKLDGITGRTYQWRKNRLLFLDWVNGETREPFVNANMKELKATGWMSNRGRQNVASFLAKELEIDWRWGASYFEHMLLDYDVHSNYGNWLYVSGVGNDPRDRRFNIAGQARRYDPEGTYQAMWNDPA